MMSTPAVTVLVFQVHGNVITTMIVQMVLMKQTVLLKAALMINLIVVMEIASMTHGNVMAGTIVLMALMRQTVHLKAVLMVSLHVTMEHVFQQVTTATAQVSTVTQGGQLIVQTVLMKAQMSVAMQMSV